MARGSFTQLFDLVIGSTTEQANVEESAAGDVAYQIIIVFEDHPSPLIEDRFASLIHTFGRGPRVDSWAMAGLRVMDGGRAVEWEGVPHR